MRIRNKMRYLVAAVVTIGIAICFVGCVAEGYSLENEDFTQTKSLGETSEVTHEYSLLGIYQKGPYDLEVTPIGLTQITKSNGKTVDCIEVAYKVNSTNDGEPADFANCTVVLNMLDENLQEVAHDVWFVDEDGNEMNATSGILEVGVPYTFYIPLREPLEKSGLKWITVSDRSGFYERSGETYWYDVRE